MEATSDICKPFVVGLEGPPGSGKTHYVMQKYGSGVYKKQPSGKWFEGYDVQKVILLDDFRGDNPNVSNNECWATPEFLRDLLKGVPLMLPVKAGTNRKAMPKIVCIATTLAFKEWFSGWIGVEESLKAEIKEAISWFWRQNKSGEFILKLILARVVRLNQQNDEDSDASVDSEGNEQNLCPNYCGGHMRKDVKSYLVTPNECDFFKECDKCGYTLRVMRAKRCRRE